MPNTTPDEIIALQARIAALEAELAALRRTQSIFALGLSHDLRTPLRAVESFSYLLEQRADTLDEQGRDHLHRIRDASARMARLLARLQTWMQASHATPAHDAVDLSLLADWCIGELRDAAPDREVDIDIAGDMQIVGDERLLRTALHELIHNAWTYARPGEGIVIRIDGERLGDGFHLRIRDAGIGFDATQAAKLGEPFQRLHGPEHEGTGLGLAIVRAVAERHGGTLHLDNAAEGGTIAHLHLPETP